MKLAYPKSREVQIDLLSTKTAFPAYATFKNGVIKQAMGLEPISVTPLNNLVCSHITATGEGLAYMKDGYVYKITGGNFSNLRRFNKLAADNPVFVEMRTEKGTDVLLSGNVTSVLLRNGACGYAADFPPAACAAVRCGRVFSADSGTGYILRWSGADDILNWKKGLSDGGYLNVDMQGGKIQRLFDLGGGLVALRENGITRFAVNGTPESFSVTENILLTGKVLPATSAVLGEKLFFFCEGETMLYAKGKVQKLGCEVFDDAEAPEFALATKGRYYVLKAMSKSLKRNVVYVYDDVLEAGYYLDIDVLSAYEDLDSLVFNTYIRSFRFAKYNDYEVNLGTFDFGTSKRKLLTELYAECDSDVIVNISNGRISAGYKGGGTTRLGMRGSKFTVSVLGNSEVRALKLKAEVRK